jgi:hypothetical protein
MNSIRPTNRFFENRKLLVALVFITTLPPPVYHIRCVDVGRKKNEGTAVRRGSQAGPDQPALIRRWARAFPFLADRILYRSRSTVTSLNRIDIFSFITIMDQITIKATNPKCRLYWCLIEFIDWRYSQSCWYCRPESLPL